MNTTGFLNKIYFSRRQKQLEKYATKPKEIQQKIFRHLIRQGRKTLWGKEHNYDQIDSYEQFRNQVHVNTYEELKSYIHEMRKGKENILWPGV
ncbi:MAG: GH3 auxin-responsive promoter family protein, partial [Bacteroidaceae bacterium]|nr:GH3 auxin-responsive promoter family protein [Bacteroidaceae bacterium]